MFRKELVCSLRKNLAAVSVGMVIFDHELVLCTVLGLDICLYGSCEDVSLLQVSTVTLSIVKIEVLTWK